MAEIRAFPVVEGKPEPVADLVELLENLLTDARSGNLRGLAYAISRENDGIGTGWAGGEGTRFPIGAAIAMLAQRYPLALMEG